MAQFLLDEHLSFRLADSLNQRGHDAVTVRQLQLAGADDATILLEAADRGRILATANHKDFLNLHLAWRLWPPRWGLAPPPVHAGILTIEQIRQSEIDELATMLDQFIATGAPLRNELYRWGSQQSWTHFPASRPG